jgi:hypothetical protein
MKSARWALGLLLAAAVIGGGVLAGCFSSHEAATAAGGTCSIDLGEGVPGSTAIRTHIPAPQTAVSGPPRCSPRGTGLLRRSRRRESSPTTAPRTRS